MKIRFGVSIPQEGLSYEQLKDNFQKIENLGLHSVFVYDHFEPQWNPEKTPVLENWTLISSLIRETKKIKIGTMVNCNSYRHPAVLAKMASSLDVISNGRLEFMIGAGAHETEYLGYGIPFPPSRTRIEQMKETVHIVKLMWTQHKAYFKGKHYRLEGALCYPKPLQKPHPLIWIGGGGEKITLQTAAHSADGTNFFGSPSVFRRKLNLLKNYCEKAERNYDKIQKSWAGDLAIGKNIDEVRYCSRELESRFRRLLGNQGNEQMTSGLEELRESRLVGTPEKIVQRIEEYVNLGVYYFIVIPSNLMNLVSVELLANEVAPSFST